MLVSTTGRVLTDEEFGNIVRGVDMFMTDLLRDPTLGSWDEIVLMLLRGWRPKADGFLLVQAWLSGAQVLNEAWE